MSTPLTLPANYGVAALAAGPFAWFVSTFMGGKVMAARKQFGQQIVGCTHEFELRGGDAHVERWVYRHRLIVGASPDILPISTMTQRK